MAHVDFTPSSRFSKAGQRRVIIALGVLAFLAQGVGYWFVFRGGVFFYILLVFIGLQIALLILANMQRYYLASDGTSIIYRVSLGFYSARSILWSEVSSVKLGPAYISLLLSDRRKRRISLGWVSYELVREAKELMRTECRRLQKPCHEVKPIE